MKIIIACFAVLLLALAVQANPVNDDVTIDEDLDDFPVVVGEDEPCSTKTTEAECDTCCAELNMISDFSKVVRNPLPQCDCPYRAIGPMDYADDDDDDDDE